MCEFSLKNKQETQLLANAARELVCAMCQKVYGDWLNAAQSVGSPFHTLEAKCKTPCETSSKTFPSFTYINQDIHS